MKRRLFLLVSLGFAALAVMLLGGLALYWKLLLEPRLATEAQQQAQVLAQSQAVLLAQALSEQDAAQRAQRLQAAIDQLLLLKDARRDAPFFTGIGLELDYDTVGAEPGSLDRSLEDSAGDSFKVQVELYHSRGDELLGLAEFAVGSSFFQSFSADLRRQTYVQAGFVALLLALIGSTLLILLARHERERSRFERALEDARDAAESASRAKSQFLANMSHEIRTPMNAVLGMATLLGKTPLDDRQRALIAQLGNSAKLLLGIINDILDLSRIEAGKLPTQAVDFLLDDVWNDLSAVIGERAREKGLELLYDVDPRVPRALFGDPVRFKQVLVNLVTNAIKFTERGEVVVELGLVERTANQCTVRCTVSDTGIGIAPADLPRMFDPFTQVDESSTRKHGGTGLGLAICKRLVELMGGTLNGSSEPGKGSQFWFTAKLGCVAHTAPALAAVPALPETSQGGGLRALVVDDHPTARDVLGGMLESLRFEVMLADSGESALMRLARESFDLMLIDWRLPGMSGTDVVRELHKRGLQAPGVVLISGFISDAIRQEARAVGIQVCLNKPVNPSSLFDAAMQALGNTVPPVSIPSATPTAPGEMLFGYGKRVLLAEDNEINRQVAQALLAETGVSVEVACNGLEALEKLRGGGFDLVLMDVQMPELDGLEATRRLKADPAQQGLPVIALTAHAMSGDRERFLAAGMDDYLSKPIDERQLRQVLRRWLGGKPSRPSPIAPVPAAAVPAPVKPAELPQIAGVDVVLALRRIGGKPELLWRLLADFRQRQADAAGRIREFLARQESGAAADLAHSLKGAAASLGAERIAAAASRIEQQCRKPENGSAARALLELTVKELHAALVELNGAQLPGKGAAAAPQVLPDANDPAQRLAAFKRLATALAGNELAADAHLAKLRPLVPAAQAGDCETLGQHIAALDYAVALKQLRALAQELGITEKLP